MKTKMLEKEKKEFGCETCSLRQKAQTNPESFFARLWRWHTTWCPGWKEYQLHLARQDEHCKAGTNV